VNSVCEGLITRLHAQAMTLSLGLTHREYQMRKNANEGKGDSVYNNLAYRPLCNHQPVCTDSAGRARCEAPLFIWTKKTAPR
jgi:hypothetical protein